MTISANRFAGESEIANKNTTDTVFELIRSHKWGQELETPYREFVDKVRKIVYSSPNIAHDALSRVNTRLIDFYNTYDEDLSASHSLEEGIEVKKKLEEMKQMLQSETSLIEDSIEEKLET